MFRKINNFLSLYAKSLVFVFQAAPFHALLLLLVIPLQALMPSVLIFSANKIINAVSEAKDINFIYLLVVWGIAFLLSHILIPVYSTIQGFLTDKLTLFLNTALMEKSKTITELYVYEDSAFYDDIEILSAESAWRPVNLLVFGASVIANSITALSMIVLLASFHWIIAIMMLIAIVPQSIVFYKIQQDAFEVLVSNTPDSRRLNYYSSQLLFRENIKDIQLYGLHGFFINKYKDVYWKIKKNVAQNRLKKLFMSIIFIIISVVVSIIAFYWLLGKAFAGIFAVGSILVFSSSIVYATQSVSQIVEFSSLLYDTLLYMQKFFKFMNLDTGKAEKKNNFEVFKEINFQNIIFDNISFKYQSSDNLVLKNISFSVKQGEKIAVVGENGSGKSTLMKLLCRFYQVDSGSITFDNVNIQNYDIENYRKKIGAVFQDYAKFDLTLRENVGISNVDNLNNNEEVQLALKKAEFDKDIELDSLLGIRFDGGTDLSGGQWQKLAIARAFFGNFNLLILDEPTASIDARSEFKMYEKFLELTQDKTVFFVTHRLSTVKKADKIIVLKNGLLHAFDNHENLMKNNEYYKEMYTMQASSYEENL